MTQFSVSSHIPQMSSALCMASNATDDAILSTQDLLSCSGTGASPEKMGCDGGTIVSAMLYLCEFGAVEENCVPYTAGDTWRDAQALDQCRRTCAIAGAHVRRRAIHDALPGPEQQQPEGSVSGSDQAQGGRVSSVGGAKDRAGAARAKSASATISNEEARSSYLDGATCQSSVRLLNTEVQIKNAIMTVGPVVAYIDVYRHYLLLPRTCHLLSRSSLFLSVLARPPN